MSEFVAGFAARHAAAADALNAAFAPPIGFTPTDILARIACAEAARPKGFSPQPAGPKHFRPAERGSNPTGGWDPFDPEIDQTAAEPEGPAAPAIDPITAARDAGYAEGVADALARAQEGRERDRALLASLAEALAKGAHIDREKVAEHLRRTVLHLVSRLVGEAGVSAELLAKRIGAAVDLLADHAESALLRLHPEDVALVEGKLPSTVFAIGDPHIARGAFILESASTIVEDGPDLWLEQLAAAIDRVPLPQC